MTPDTCSIIIPAYNESRRLPGTLRQLAATMDNQPGLELVLVDDGSRDNTFALMHAFKGQHPHLAIHIDTLPRRRGKGAALKHGLLLASRPNSLLYDADGAVPIDQLAPFLTAQRTHGADLVIATRPVCTGWQGLSPRALLRQGFHGLTRLGLPDIADTQCGFKLLRRDRLLPLLEVIDTDGFCFDVAMLVAARHNGLTILQHPVQWCHQPGSSVRLWRDPWLMGAELARIYWQAAAGHYRR
ncbi:MAG: glycosyltransferase [Cyanobacteria bacterium HKST-UBA06]|nr:glycosyltransferase [Cyanobacteria bacterium HKST-UBA06]